MEKTSIFKRMKKYIQKAMDQTLVRQWLLAILVFLGLVGILMIHLLPTGVDIEAGQVSPTDIEAPRTIVNRPQTDRLQEEAASRAVKEASEDPENYEINHATVIKAEERFSGALSILELGIGEEAELTSEEIQQQLQDEWNINLAKNFISVITVVDEEEFSLFIEESKQDVYDVFNTRISEENIDEVQEQLERVTNALPVASILQEAAYEIGEQIISPNLVMNTQKIEEARLRAVQAVEPVTFLKGEIIVRKGSVVTEEQIQVLQDLGLHRTELDYFSIFGLIVIVIFLMMLIAVYLYKFNPSILRNEEQLALLSLVILVVIFIVRVLWFIQWSEAIFLAPIALAGMLLTILLDSRVAITVSIVLAVAAGIVNDFDIVITLLSLTGGLVAVFSVSQVSERADLMRAGFVVGGVNFLIMISLGLIRGETNLLIHSYLGIFNGFFSSIIAIGSLPYLESLFKITSSIRLLELSNPNQPLLRRLLMETPGTYHHSILVGNLAEAAADAIGADSLLARVGATYHDIGKLKRPYFFIENQVGSENPHDKTSSTLSTLIITSHVKDGLELAREYKLPEVIVKFITQHHGTDLVKFFYHKAKENDDEKIEEKDFRYPGPKSRTKETAIVSLADAVEAAVRSLGKPVPGKIKALVRKIIKDRLNDGQLDESDLTFKELDVIAGAFVNVLIGIFHARVEYPENITREDIEGKRK